MNKALLLGLIAIVGAALIGGLMVVGGPGYARLEKQDAKRAGDLQLIAAFLLCRSEKKVLPQTLDDSDHCPAMVIGSATKDAVTGSPYEYRRLDDAHFEVCATFATEAETRLRGRRYNALRFEGQVGCRAGTVNLENG